MSRVEASFPERAGLALNDAVLQAALRKAGQKFTTLRLDAFKDFSEGEALRDRARQTKEATLQKLDVYVERFADNVERLGGHVHWAATAGEAREIIVRLARERGVRMAVKSKSMATEEIELNAALERAGITPVETDLGEYIIQLAGEKPSHIIVPAIHKTKGQIAGLFAKELKREVAADPEALTKVARKELREKFFLAGMGITGANFGVAESGTIVLVTNEGNGRMVTTLPRIHVAVMGVEKVIPSMTDLIVFLQLLARSATGQKITAYTTLIRGPRKPTELDGPEELHLVLLDNGRVKEIAGPFREALYCLRCGACLNACPVYREVGGHAYGYTYPGPIGILLTAISNGYESVKHLAHASSLCGACEDVCPVRIRIPRMLVELRERLSREKVAPWAERFAFRVGALVMAHPFAYRLASRVVRVAQRLPFLAGRWTKGRDFPAPSAKSFMERWQETERGRRP